TGGRPEVFLRLKRRIQKLWSKAPWLTLLVLLTFLHVFGYCMMLWQEPAGSPIRWLPTYTYFFLITVTTVGFGDVVPVSMLGRLSAGIIAVGGIGAAAVALSSLFTSIGNYIKRREKGFLEFHMKGHIVIFGNRGGETMSLIQRLVADQQSRGTEIVLCSQGTERNPFPELIEFV